MINNIGGVTSDLLHFALDTALVQHRLIANNIANVNSSGFLSKQLDFAEQLNEISAQLAAGDKDGAASHVRQLREALASGEPVPVTTAGEVALDEQMVSLTENTLRYQALLKASAKRGDIVKMAIREGRS